MRNDDPHDPAGAKGDFLLPELSALVSTTGGEIGAFGAGFCQVSGAKASVVLALRARGAGLSGLGIVRQKNAGLGGHSRANAHPRDKAIALAYLSGQHTMAATLHDGEPDGEGLRDES